MNLFAYVVRHLVVVAAAALAAVRVDRGMTMVPVQVANLP